MHMNTDGRVASEGFKNDCHWSTGLLGLVGFLGYFGYNRTAFAPLLFLPLSPSNTGRFGSLGLNVTPFST
jgi:hypothetical protein